jgi:hypothetical protein
METRRTACVKSRNYRKVGDPEEWSMKYVNSDSAGPLELACGGCRRFCEPRCLDICNRLTKESICSEHFHHVGKWDLREEFELPCGGCRPASLSTEKYGNCPK